MEIFLHGFATTPAIWPSGGPALRFADLEREAKRVGEGLSEGMTLIGWSMGGMIAILVAAKFPDKVKKLILISTTPKFIRADDFPAGLSPALLVRLEKRIAKVGTGAFHELVFKNGETVGLAYLPPEQAKAELDELARVDLRKYLDKIKVPTLIIHGDSDEICLPAAAEYLHDKITGSNLIMLAGVGHAPMIEAPEKFNEVLCSIKN